MKLIPAEKKSDLFFKIIENPHTCSRKEWLLAEIKNLTREARGDFNSVIENIWFPNSEFCLFFENKNSEIIAYSLAGWLEQHKVAIIYSTIVKEAYQEKGLSLLLNHKLIKKLFFNNFLKPFYLVARTANPIIIGMMAKYLNAYPSPFRKIASGEEIEITKKAVNSLSPECDFDSKNFVIKKAFGKDKELPSEFKKIYYYSEEINKFCNTYLEYEKKEGNAFMVIGKVDFGKFIRYCFITHSPDNNSKEREKQFWAKYFRVYDTLNESISYKNLLKEVSSNIEFHDSSRVLDLGCGTGNLYNSLNKNIFYVGIDLNDVALNIAKNQIANYKKAYLIKCDIKNTCFKDSVFDSVISNNVLYTLNKKDILLVLKEIRRIIKPKGKFTATGLIEGFSPLMIYFDTLIKELKCYGIYKTIIHWIKTLPSAIKIIYYNIKHLKNNKKNFSFFSIDFINKIFIESSFNILEIKKVYANQALLVRAKRG